MSTNSGIALRQGDTYLTIYCHWDGHPKTMLPILRENYNSFDLANKLISHGDASYIDKKLEPTSDFHKMNTPEPDVCMFYHRDRGDDWESCRPVCYTRRELFRQPNFEYIHVFEDGQWNSYNMNGRKVNMYGYA
jgi:hypothetical protein